MLADPEAKKILKDLCYCSSVGLEVGSVTGTLMTMSPGVKLVSAGGFDETDMWGPQKMG
jgi:hypothetical protein